MTTVFLAVASAFVAALEADPPVSPSVERATLKAVPKGKATAVVVRLIDAKVADRIGGGAIVFGTQLAVECYVRAGASTPADEAVDALTEAVINRLMTDPTFAGLVGDIGIAGLGWDFDADGEKTVCVTVVFNVRHASAANSITHS